MKPAIVINANGTPIEIIDVDTPDLLSVMQGIVGGYVEAVSLTPNVTLWCNEDGIAAGLPANVIATFVWHKTFWPRVDSNHSIVGNVILTGGSDENGDVLGIDFEELAYKYGIEVTYENVSS
jgi:hypothetical protein